MPSVNIEDTTSEPQLAAVRTPLQTSDRVFITINDITYRGTLANLLAFITTNFDLSAYVTTESIINVLTSTSDTVPASAGTVKALKDLIDTINTSLTAKCPLVDGLVPSANLPSFVDDALEFANLAAFPVTGESGKIYIAANTNFIYRWTGSTYVLIGDGTSVDVVGVGASSFVRYDVAQTLSNDDKARVQTTLGMSIYALASSLSSYLTTSTAASTYGTITNSRYQFVSDAGTTYTVLASAVTANGNTIIELSNNSLTSITVNAATSTGKTAGDSVTIHITGTYAAQLLVASGVTLNGTLAFSANAKIKTLIYRGSNTWTVLGG